MSHRPARSVTALLLVTAALHAGVPSPAPAADDGAPRPNIVLIFVDNFGNGDLGCFGSTLHRTPNVDRLAREGTTFSSFYVSSGVCTPSRASLMTGCYPRRINLHVDAENGAVLRPVSPKGLNPDELTIAEVLKPAGYAAACIGKWHLGDQPDFLPTRQGFDTFFGIPYSDDMTKDKRPDSWPELPLMRDERILGAPVDRKTLVRRCTEEAMAFIERSRGRPFFLYLPFPSPGSTPRPFASPEFQGKSRNGAYGDAVEELDWSTGEILATLTRLELDRTTLVIWTSDNGAVRRVPTQGSCAPYKGFSYDTSEGAMRMPCVMRWAGKIPAGRVCDELCSTIDLLPTFAGLAGVPLPGNPIDGHDIRPLILGEPGACSPWDVSGFCFYHTDQLQAIRSGPWKLYLPLAERYVTLDRKVAPSKLELFDVRSDPGEAQEVSARNPEVVGRLLTLAERAREELGDGNRSGSGQRSAGWVAAPKPLRP